MHSFIKIKKNDPNWPKLSARKDIILPLSKPVKGINGDLIHEILVPKGTNVNVSILASNRNPELWGPDSYDWKPERWLAPLSDTVVSARLPGIYSNLYVSSASWDAFHYWLYAQITEWHLLEEGGLVCKLITDL